MEPPKGILASLGQFILFLPYFTGLLLLGVIKGLVFCPFICLVVTISNSVIILGLLPAHAIWTFYCTLSAIQLGPILKFVLCLCLPIGVVLWPVIGIAGSFLGGVLYGFLSPIFATFDAVGEGKSDPFFHTFYDGTWSTISGSFTIVRDFKDVCFHSYFSLMDDLRQVRPGRNFYEIRLLHLPGSIIAAVLGVIVDLPIITLIALWKSPIMLFKGWHRLFHDLIGREGPFLETICVPIAGLVILLWPLAVVGAVLGSILSCLFLGAYAGLVVYQESSLFYGLCFIVASISIYDEYSNDVLDMPEGSCFPRPKYRKNDDGSVGNSRASSFSRPGSFKNTSSQSGSIGGSMIEVKPLELLEGLFKECRQQGEVMVLKGLISSKDIEEAKSSKCSQVISIGLPAYCLLQSLLRSAKANSTGILLSDNIREITSSNSPKDAFFDWFLNPFLILKEQINAADLSVEEEECLGKLVLLHGDPERLKSLNVGSFQSERRKAELEAFARRLQGITKSMSRYPTFRRRFEDLVKTLSEDLDRKHGGSRNTGKGAPTVGRSKSAISRLLSQKSYKRKSSMNGSDQQSQLHDVQREMEIA